MIRIDITTSDAVFHAYLDKLGDCWAQGDYAMYYKWLNIIVVTNMFR